MEIIFPVISVLIFTAVLFYKFGRDSKKSYSPDIVKYILNDLYESLAAEFYPDDLEGKNKIARRMYIRAKSDLEKLEGLGL